MPDHREDELTIGAKSVIEKLVTERQERERQEQIAIENEEEWKKAINTICSTAEGELMIKYMLRHNRLFKPGRSTNQVAMVEDSGKQRVYLELIRPYLKPEIIGKLETQ